MKHTVNEKNVYFKLYDLLKKKLPCVHTTITGTNGSTPQKPGSSALFSESGLVAGTIGGGVTELKVEQMACKNLESKTSGFCSFNLGYNISNDTEAICGGEMQILLDANPQKHIEIFEDLYSSLADRIPGILITSYQAINDFVPFIERRWITDLNFNEVTEDFDPNVRKKIEKMLKNPVREKFDETRWLEKGKEKIVLYEKIVPPEQIVIAGAGHIGKALSHLTKLLDFEVIVWDDRKEYATKDNLPDAHTIISGSLENALGKLKIDQSTFLVIVTRGHKNDAETLKVFIDLPLAYIGLMGSRKKIAQIREMFLEKKWATKEQWDRIYAPVGLDIHSVTVQEIAISIAAQLVEVRNKKQHRR